MGRKKEIVLRLMRENALLPPHRRPQGTPNLHDGTIATDRPNEMRGTDGIRIETADDFLNQVKFWGVAPSFGLKAEPQTNGVAERFNRTLKEQAIHGRIFRNIKEVRAAVTEFKDRHNHHWRLEKPGFLSPLEARQACAM